MTPIRDSSARRWVLTALLTSSTWVAAVHAGGAAAGSAPPGVDPTASAPPGVNAAASARLPDVDVFAPPPPTDLELAGDSLHRFIVHHATVHYVNTGVTGGLARWRGGRPESICPRTLGLDPGFNAFVTARIRALAATVGAPVQADDHCPDNVRILFTTDPQAEMASVLRWAGRSLHLRYPHQMDRQLRVSGGHPVQGWFITAPGGGGILNTDPGFVGPLSLSALWPYVIPTSAVGNGARSGIVGVILVIDTRQVAGYTIGSIADFAAMLALTVVQSPQQCDPLPSILDLMSPSCPAREQPAGVTAGDLAFLKGLYYHNTGLGSSLTRDEIERNMLQQFKSRLPAPRAVAVSPGPMSSD